MSDGTHIEWTDATWNVVNGCSVVSPGCTNCYAMRLAGTRMRHHPSRQGLTVPSKAGPVWNGTVRFNEKVLLEPLRWRRARKIFVCAHGDLFHEGVPDKWIDRVFAVMALCPQHTFQVLTKRPERMRQYLTHPTVRGRVLQLAIDTRLKMSWRTAPMVVDNRLPLPNVWLGTSVEDQARADERIPVLLDTPAAVRWLSCEPLLGPVDLSEWLFCPNSLDHSPIMDPTTGVYECCSKCDYTGIAGFSGRPIVDWVIAGGESGPGARPMHPDWARGLRDQCSGAGVPFLFKQWGDWGGVIDDDDIRHVRQWVLPPNAPVLLPGEPREYRGALMHRLGKKAAGRLLDGVQHDDYPA